MDSAPPRPSAVETEPTTLGPRLRCALDDFARAHALTTRQLDVLVEGHVEGQAIANRLGLSVNTIHNHFKSLYRRTGTRRVGSRLDAPSREMLETMLDCAERIRDITNDLLDLSRVDRAEPAAFRPGRGLQAALRLATTRLVSSDVAIETDLDLDVELQGRVGDVHQVFLDLLDNAAREVAHGGTLRVRAKVEDGAYVVRVEDSGRGVDEATAALVFQPFWTSRPNGEGTGLGLAVVRSTVEQHGGSVEVARSELGGAPFTVRLPLATATTARLPSAGAQASAGE